MSLFFEFKKSCREVIYAMNQKPPYKPITQLPYHCVPACLKMVLDRRKIKHGTQDEIGHELGLIVPNEIAHKFKKVKTGSKPIAGYGTQVAKKRFSINHFFRKYKIDLKESYFPLEKVKNHSKFISDNISKANDVIVCFNSKRLFGSGDWGHACVIQSINRNIVTLIDPGRSVPKKRRAELPNLIDAIKRHGKKRRGGFWVISE